MWETFGLEKDPFDIKAVEKGGRVPVSTFVGRDEFRTSLKKIILEKENSLSLVVAQKGVGKTSLGNVVRDDLFDQYFTPLLEIDTQHTWNSKEFIYETLSTLYEGEEYAKTYSHLDSRYLKVCKLIREKLNPLFYDITSGFDVQAGGFGGGKTYGKTINRDSYAMLKANLRTIVAVAKENGYKGIILQYNNLDNLELESEKFVQLLADLRDFFLSDNVHFIFLGNEVMAASFKGNSKVRDCVSLEIPLGELSFSDVDRILKKRYSTFKIPDRQPSAPITEDALKLVFELFHGNIRQIFYSLHHAVTKCEKFVGKAKPLNSDDVRKILFSLAMEKINQVIQPRAFEVLNYIVNKGDLVTNAKITKKLKLKTQNTSKYIKQLKDANLIAFISKVGREVNYQATYEAVWLLLNPEPGTQKSMPDY